MVDATPQTVAGITFLTVDCVDGVRRTERKNGLVRIGEIGGKIGRKRIWVDFICCSKRRRIHG